MAAYALCTHGDRILLCRIAPGHTDGFDGFWTLPGGGVDFGEHPQAAALRELTEETGLEGSVDAVAAVDSRTGRFTDPGDGVLKDFHSIRIVYRVRITGGELRDEPEGSTDTCRWFARDEVPTERLVDLATSALDLVL